MMADVFIPRQVPWPLGDGCLFCWLISRMLALTELIGFAVGDSGCNCAPAYVTGDRSSSITVTTTATIAGGGGTVSNLVDGVLAGNSTDAVAFLNGQNAAGLEIKFQFGFQTKITEAKWYHITNTTGTHGTWKWQGSNDGSAWADIGSSFTLGGSATQTQTQLNGNLAGYIYYRLLGISGTMSSSPWCAEIEFKQCAC